MHQTVERLEEGSQPAKSDALTAEQKKVASALACCVGVARLRLKHGGWFVPLPVTNGKVAERVKALRRGHAIKRTLKGLV